MGETGRPHGAEERVDVGECFILVLPSSCSITPPVGEGEDLQQMEGGDGKTGKSMKVQEENLYV